MESIKILHLFKNISHKHGMTQNSHNNQKNQQIN